MSEVIVYCTAYCPYCLRAKSLLDSKGISYTTIDIDEQPEKRFEMQKRSRRTSVPQIFINDYHVGGFDDMAAMDREGKLDELLSITNQNEF